MLTTLAAVLISALAILLVVIVGVWWRQERIAYQPPTQWPPSPADVRRIDYVAADGQSLFAFVVEAGRPPAGIVLAFHGNADLAVWQIPRARELARRLGWCIVLAEYRGYGGLGGEPSYLGVRDDARAAWRAARQIGREFETPVPRYALFGHSLGSAVATELATEIASGMPTMDGEGSVSPTAVIALVLQSPFTSARDMVRIVSTRPVQLVWKIISRVHYDTRSGLRNTTAPVSIAHGARDWLVPAAMGQELFTGARVPGQLLVVDRAGHNDVADVGGESYWRWLSAALSDRPASCLEAGSTPRTETLD